MTHIPIIQAPRHTPFTTMMQAAAAPWRDEEEAEEYRLDPRGFLLDRCQVWADNAEYYHNYIVTATYYLPAYEVMPDGRKFFRPETTQDEALWQGKVGLVIKKGPLAFVDCPQLGVFFLGQNIEIGDWVQYDIHDPRQFVINRVHCRLLKDVHVIARVKDPRLVY